MMKKLCHLLGYVIMLNAIWLAKPVLAHDALLEYTAKAGFIYNFAMLTEWPPGAQGSNLQLCYFGANGILPYLESIQGKPINNRRVDVRLVAAPEEARDCHLIFISETDRMSMSRLMREIAGLPILTVTDDESLAKSGTMILLRPERKRLVFEIDVAATRNANLNLSARLLRLSRGGIN